MGNGEQFFLSLWHLAVVVIQQVARGRPQSLYTLVPEPQLSDFLKKVFWICVQYRIGVGVTLYESTPEPCDLHCARLAQEHFRYQ